MAIKFFERILLKLFNRFKRKKIKAVFEDDLDNLLISLNIHKDVIEGKFYCLNCDNPITLENIGIILRKGGKIQLVCNNNKCISQL